MFGFQTLLLYRMGYERILFARPELSSLLFSKIPSDKIRMSKKVASFEEGKDGVTVTFEDNTSAHGDILVGADGTHSAVRQQLYKNLEKQGLLPKADKKEMRKGYISLVGTTSALDTAQYPGMLEEDSESNLIIGDKKTPYTVCRIKCMFPLFLSLAAPNEKSIYMQIRTHPYCIHLFLLHIRLQIVGDVHDSWQQDLLERRCPVGRYRSCG